MAQSQDFARGLAAMAGVKRPERPGPDPDELEPQRDDDVPFERPDDQTETETDPDAIAGRSTVSEEITRLREQLAAEGARRDQMQREVEFLARASIGQQQAQQPPAPDPVREAMNLFRIDPHTWNQMIADPERGAELATNALQSAVLIGSQLSQNQQQAVLSQVAQHMQARDQQNVIAREGEEMKRMFWERNQNLLPYERLVRQFASEVAGEVNQGRGYTSDQVLHEIGSRTRAELRANYGVEIDDGTGGRGARVSSMSDARQRLRPAAAEMGSGLGRRSAPLTPVQKSLYRLARRG
jgi:hypothetical protein